MRKVRGLFVAPSSMTTASMIDTLALSKRQLSVAALPKEFGAGTAYEFHSLQVLASELGVFLPAWDPSFMNTLTKMYDGELYEERRRTGKVNHLIIERPLLSILGGATPSYIHSFLPDGAWEQGFTSRTLFIFSSEIVEKDIWEDEIEHEVHTQIEEDLVHDLQSIFSAYGPFTFAPESKREITEWDRKKMPPIPSHPKLTHYNSRRLTHLLKLCMVASMARASDRYVTRQDYDTAHDWLLEAERIMPDIFEAMGSTLDSRTLDDALAFIKKIHARDGRAVSQHLIYEYLRNRLPIHAVEKGIEIMEKSKQIQRIIHQGVSAFVPLR